MAWIIMSISNGHYVYRDSDGDWVRSFEAAERFGSSEDLPAEVDGEKIEEGATADIIRYLPTSPLEDTTTYAVLSNSERARFCPEECESLAKLKSHMELHGCVAWDDVDFAFGPPPKGDIIWGYDRYQVLSGSCADDLEIKLRQETINQVEAAAEAVGINNLARSWKRYALSELENYNPTDREALFVHFDGEDPCTQMHWALDSDPRPGWFKIKGAKK